MKESSTLKYNMNNVALCKLVTKQHDDFNFLLNNCQYKKSSSFIQQNTKYQFLPTINVTHI